MGPLVVVKTEVGVEAGSGLPSVRVGFQVDLLVLHRALQPLHKEIIRVPPLDLAGHVQGDEDSLSARLPNLRRHLMSLPLQHVPPGQVGCRFRTNTC